MNATRTTLVALVIAAAPALLSGGVAHAAPNAAFNPQPDPPSISQHRDVAAIGNPNDRPGVSVGLGGPDTAPSQHH